jgi:hypothetical protein
MRARRGSGVRARALAAPLMLATVVIGLRPATVSTATCLTGTGLPVRPGAASQFLGVAASTGRAWAVGSYTRRTGSARTLIEYWPGNSYLFGVAAISGSDAWAVGAGSTSQGLIEHWNGTTWTQVPSHSPAGVTGGTVLTGVAAASASDAWAVGSYNTGPGTKSRTLIEHWTGTAWTPVPSPNPGGSAIYIQLASVAATSASNAWAVGQYYNTATRHYQMLIEHWNGTTWTQVPSPSPASPTRNNLLAGVAATSATDAWAVGKYHNHAARQDQTLIEHWNGTTWTQVPSPNPSPPRSSNQLTAVAATSASNAWAVGKYFTRGPATLSFAEHWNGTSWTQVPSPNPSPSYDVLAGVATTSDTGAWAAGVSITGQSEQSLAFRCS